MRILLLHLTNRENEGGDYYRTESLGLGYIAAVLRRDGHEVELFDADMQRLNYRRTLEGVLQREFDCLGITALQDSKDAVMRIARDVRKKRKSVIILAGGYFPTLATEGMLRACPEIDFVVRGEGEQVASDVFGRISRNEDWRPTPGVAYIENGDYIANPAPPLIADLDTLPFPARDVIIQAPKSSVLGASVASGRGCYHKCSFCSIRSFYSVSGSHLPRRRSPSNFVDEIESVVAATGVRRFQFVDDDFVGPGDKGKERAASIAEEIRNRSGLKIRFSMECRTDEVHVDTLELLKEAGLIRVFLGVEAGVQRMLDTFNKGTTVEQNKRAIEMVREVGLDVDTGFIMYDPYTTVAEIEENLRFIREMGLQGDIPPTSLLRLELYEGIPLMDKVRADGLVRRKGLDFTYKFQDPQTRIAWIGSVVSDSLAKLTRRKKIEAAKAEILNEVD